jgi:hypothetical protein
MKLQFPNFVRNSVIAGTLSLVAFSGAIPVYATQDGSPHDNQEKGPQEQPHDNNSDHHTGPSQDHPMGGGHIPKAGGDTDNSINQDISADSNQQQGQGQSQKANGGKAQSDATSYGSQQSQSIGDTSANVQDSGNSTNSGNGFGGAGGQGGTGGSLEHSGNSKNDIKTQGGAGYGGTGGTSSSEGGKSQNDIKTDINAGGGSSSSEGGKSDVKTDVKADGGTAQNGPQTTTVGPNMNLSTSGGNTLTNGSNSAGNNGVTITDNSKSVYKQVPFHQAPNAGNPGSSSYQNVICPPIGGVIVTTDHIQGKRFGVNLTAPVVGGGLGVDISNPSNNEGYKYAVARSAQTRAELNSTYAGHPLNDLFMTENTLTAVTMTGKIRKLNAIEQVSLNSKAIAAVQATSAIAKSGKDASFGCGKVQGGQVIIDQPQVPSVPNVPNTPLTQIQVLQAPGGIKATN